MEEARQGRDAATLEVVMEAAGPVNTQPAGRFRGARWTGTSRSNWPELPAPLTVAIAIQPPMVVA